MIPDLPPPSIPDRAWRRLAVDLQLPEDARLGLENSLLMQRYCLTIACEDFAAALREVQPFKWLRERLSRP